MKLRAVLTRTVNRDFIDIAYLLKYFSLENMFIFYKEKYNADDISIVKRALLKCCEIDKNSWHKEVEMLKNNINVEEIPAILKKAIKNYNFKNKIGAYIRDIFKIKSK